MQRLVGKESKDMKRLTYASVLEYDNAKYVKYIGGKGLFGGGRDKVLYLKANETLKSPSHDEATKLMSGLLKSDETFRKNLNYLGTTISNKEIQKILKDPNGSTAKAWYDILNSNMTLSSESNTYVTKKYTDAVTKKGITC